MQQLFLRLSFSQSLITRLMDHEGLTSAREFTIIRPSDLSDSFESVYLATAANQMLEFTSHQERL